MQKIHRIEEVIEREIRPVLQRDGGNLELVDIEGDRVLVRFMGACSNCPVSAVTLKDVVQNKLREAVSEALVVEEARNAAN